MISSTEDKKDPEATSSITISPKEADDMTDEECGLNIPCFPPQPCVPFRILQKAGQLFTDGKNALASKEVAQASDKLAEACEL